MVDATVATLREYDVVCGRVKLAYTHSGNVHFRKMINDHATEYRAASVRSVKKRICYKIIEEIHSKGGRFLSFVKKYGSYTDSSPMVEISKTYTYEKVSHALRSLNYKDPIADQMKIIKSTDCKDSTNKHVKDKIGTSSICPRVTMKRVQECEREIDAVNKTMEENVEEFISNENKTIPLSSFLFDNASHQAVYNDFQGTFPTQPIALLDMKCSLRNDSFIYPYFVHKQYFYNTGYGEFKGYFDIEHCSPQKTGSTFPFMESTPSCLVNQNLEPMVYNAVVTPPESPANMKTLFSKCNLVQQQIYPNLIETNTDGNNFRIEEHPLSSCNEDYYHVPALEPEICYEYYNADIIEDDEYTKYYYAHHEMADL